MYPHIKEGKEWGVTRHTTRASVGVPGGAYYSQGLTRCCTLQLLLLLLSAIAISSMGLLRRGECIDADERCSGWAAEGECKKNPGYMLTSCRLSCHSCSPTSKEAATAVEAADRFHAAQAA